MPLNYIMTYTGKRMNILNPRIEDFCIEDIAHHLSNICRYTGAVKTFYSVAQHCVLVSRYAQSKREGLFHDSPESNLNDCVAPLKKSGFMQSYCVFEDVHEKAIAEKWKLQYPWPPDVKVADGRVFFMEVRALLRNPEEFGNFYPQAQQYKYSDEALGPVWSPRKAEVEFLLRYTELFGDTDYVMPGWGLRYSINLLRRRWRKYLYDLNAPSECDTCTCADTVDEQVADSPDKSIHTVG
jgi:hypothetical protein